MLATDARMRTIGYTQVSDLALMENQRSGIEWGLRKMRCTSSSRGGIFADSEGRGKTVQALTMIMQSKFEENGTAGCSLVVTEKTSVQQFCSEIERFFPNVAVRIAVYSNNEVRHLWGDKRVYYCNRVRAAHKFKKSHGPSLESFRDADILLTHYACLESLYKRVGLSAFVKDTERTLLRAREHNWRSADDIERERLYVERLLASGSDARVPWLKKIYPHADVLLQFTAEHITEDGPPLLRHRFAHIVLDEGHRIRNHTTNTARLVLGLTARYYWALTASPVYYRDTDVWALLRFVHTPNLPTHAHMDLLIRRAADEEKCAGEFTARIETLMRESIRQPFDNNDGVEEVTAITRALGRKRRRCRAATTGAGARAKSSHWRTPTKTVASSLHYRGSPFAEERCVRTHSPEVERALYLREERIPTFYSEREQQLYLALASADTECRSVTWKALKLFHTARKMTTDIRLVDDLSATAAERCRYSTKILRLCALVNSHHLVPTQDKMVVFCEFPATCVRIVDALRHTCSVVALSITGSMSADQRAAVLDRFKSDAEVRVLVLTFCGKSGLNLQHANHVVFMNRCWSKETHTQALGRCYRTGQTKDVHVTFLSVDVQIERHIEHLNVTCGKLTCEVLGKLVADMLHEAAVPLTKD